MSQKPNLIEFLEIDLDELKEAIKEAPKLEDNEEFFAYLVRITEVKTHLKDVLDEIGAMETDVKGLINSKAKALYGGDWQAIKGEKFKITRSKTGSMYLVNGKPNAKFIKTKVSVDSKAVDEFTVSNDRLPAGIELNDKRGESLRITLK